MYFYLVVRWLLDVIRLFIIGWLLVISSVFFFLFLKYQFYVVDKLIDGVDDVRKYYELISRVDELSNGILNGLNEFYGSYELNVVNEFYGLNVVNVFSFIDVINELDDLSRNVWVLNFIVRLRNVQTA